jgi:hypothetical protein
MRATGTPDPSRAALGANWRVPQQVISARLIKFSAQIEF